MKTTDFSTLLTRYLTHYLPVQRNLSSNTICSYRDTFKLLLIFCRDVKEYNIAKLRLPMLDKNCIEEFLLWLANVRGASPSTYNQRLCAIHAFFDYVIAEEPGYIEQCIQIHNIPRKIASSPRKKPCGSFPMPHTAAVQSVCFMRMCFTIWRIIWEMTCISCPFP